MTLELAGLLLVATGAHAETPATQPIQPSSGYVFDGMLGYREADGSLVPLIPDKVFVGWGAGRCQWSLQSAEDLNVSEDGTFRFLVSEDSIAVMREVRIQPDGSLGTPTCVETTSWPCYRFRAHGCDDTVVEFGPKPPPRIIELDCPGRTRPRRDG